ncbi:TPA: hypothetical protein DEP96_03510 [Candidatus Uhrbacteria bacterium]|nr:hypothetical protein [Candidatus Uhrbacteria bacterium]
MDHEHRAINPVADVDDRRATERPPTKIEQISRTDQLEPDFATEDTEETRKDRLRAKQVDLAERNQLIKEQHEHLLQQDRQVVEDEDIAKLEVYGQVLLMQSKPNFPELITSYERQLSRARDRFAKSDDKLAVNKVEAQIKMLAAIVPEEERDTWYNKNNMNEEATANKPEHDWRAERPQIDLRGIHAKELHTADKYPDVDAQELETTARATVLENRRVQENKARIAVKEADIATRAKAEVLQSMLVNGGSAEALRGNIDMEIADAEAESADYDDESPEMDNLKKLKAQREVLNEMAREEAKKAVRTVVPVERKTKTPEAARTPLAQAEVELDLLNKEKKLLSFLDVMGRLRLNDAIIAKKNDVEKLALQDQTARLYASVNKPTPKLDRPVRSNEKKEVKAETRLDRLNAELAKLSSSWWPDRAHIAQVKEAIAREEAKQVIAENQVDEVDYESEVDRGDLRRFDRAS